MSIGRHQQWAVSLVAGFLLGASASCKQDDEPTLEPCAEATGAEACRYLYGEERPAVVCPGASIANSVLESTDDFPDNVALAFASEWFESFGDGDFHLSAMRPTEIDMAAVWQLGDPAVDIDGEPRPMDDGSPDFAGADRIP